MPNYGIMRVEKRHRSALYGLEIEANRTLEKHILSGREFARSDIDWDLTPMIYSAALPFRQVHFRA